MASSASWEEVQYLGSCGYMFSSSGYAREATTSN